MDYLKNAQSQMIDGRQLNFIRCDRDGNELSPEALAQMNFTNSTIDRIVTETAGKLGAPLGSDGSYSDGFTF